jgi:replication factor A1
MSEKPKRYDVIRVSSLKKIEIKKNSEQESQWIINLSAPAEVLVNNLTHTLGTPQEIAQIKSGGVDFSQIVNIKPTALPIKKD